MELIKSTVEVGGRWRGREEASGAPLFRLIKDDASCTLVADLA